VPLAAMSRAFRLASGPRLRGQVEDRQRQHQPGKDGEQDEYDFLEIMKGLPAVPQQADLSTAGQQDRGKLGR
jgi:hypothetical protein